MAIILNNNKKVVLLTQKLTYLRSLILHLYQNDVTPDGSTDETAFVEADFPGYDPQTLTDFSAAYLNAVQNGETDTGVHTFEMTGAAPVNDIYGWYATTEAGALVFSERNPLAPVPMDHVGAVYVVLIQFYEAQY